MNGFQETTLAHHSRREIASRIGDALMDLTGQIYEAEVLAIDHRSKDVAEIRLRVRVVPDSEIPDKEG